MKRVGVKATHVGLGGLVTPTCAAGTAMADMECTKWIRVN